MQLEIKSFINEIKEKTGLDLSVYDESGRFIFGQGSKGDLVTTDFQVIKQNEKDNYTLFYFNYKNAKFIGKILGADKSSENYAYLLSELAERWIVKESEVSREEFYRTLLLGEINTFDLDKYMSKYSLKNLPAFVMILSLSKSAMNFVKSVLKTYGGNGRDFFVKIEDNMLAFVKFIDEEAEEYQSSYEYAEFLQQSIYEETGEMVKIAIGGTVKTIANLSVSFLQAQTALRMSENFNSKGEICSFKEFMLIKMLEDLPKYKLNEYLDSLMDFSTKEIFLDEEITSTAEEFIENSLNISETSRKLYLHRNTLTYRLDKIEKETGLNVRKFNDAVTFRLITILSKLVK